MIAKRFSLIILVVVLLASCGGPAYHERSGLSKKQRDKIVSVAGSYIGTPYRYGGTNTRGFDCSGLVYRVYRQALGVKIPRTTQTQFKGSRKIDSGHALAGDLVFFRIYGGRIDHVGLMINNYQFIHASKSNGVIISDFANEYYRERFVGIRRLY